MNETAIGASLTISGDVLNKIAEAEVRIKRLEETTRTSADKITKSFRSMGDLGVQYFIDKLKLAQAELEKFGGVNVKSSSNAFGALGNNAAAAAASVTQAAVSMSQFGERLFNTKKNLAELIEERKTLTKELTKGEGIPLKDQQRWVDALEEVNALIKEQMKGAQKLADEYQKAQEKIAKANKKTYAELAKLYQQQNLKQNTTYQGALSFAENANTINRRTKAIQYLTQARAQLSTTDANYTQKLRALNDAIKKMNAANEQAIKGSKSLQQQHNNLMNTSDQLMRKLALIFSISQIQGYVNKLIQVRGEFELQNTALASILQNKDQADKLFGQITELAVKSPFTVKELTTYTKSLAAYQFQYEELYDTTKRLADVASGLGVDMQRLILAVGQVKAANYLRGTEVRQFTEAGFNILGELAKYYSELEGRMISVGDVQERVTKRMVAFGDVEEVFKRVTNAGGLFYQMQEKQAQTLAGLMSNLKDSIDIMLNDIGKANDSTLKDTIKNVGNILKNWREVAWYIEKVAGAFVIYKGATMLAALGNNKFAASLIPINKGIDKLNVKIPFLAKSLRFLGSVTQGIIAGGALLLVGWLFDLWRESTRASREAELLKNNLQNLVNVDYGQVDKMVDSFDNLIARLKESNAGSQERRDIISELNSGYGQYLDFIVDETTSIEELTDAYDDVIKRMKEKAALATFEKGFQQITQSYQDNLQEAKDSFTEEISEGLRVDVGVGNLKKTLKPTKDELNDLFNIIQQRVRETDEDLLDSSREQRNLLQEIVKEYYGEGVKISQDYLKTVPLIDIYLKMKKQEKDLQEDINSTYRETLKSREANIALTKRENELELEKQRINKSDLSPFETKKALAKAVEDFELDVIDIKLQFGEISEEESKRAKEKILNWATNTVKDVNERMRKELSFVSEEDLSNVLIGQEEQATGLTAIQKTVKQNWESQNQIIKEQLNLKDQGLSIDDKLLQRAQKMEALYRTKANILGVELNYQEKINEATRESINTKLPQKYQLDLVDSLKPVSQLLTEANDKYTKSEALLKQINAQKAIGVAIDETARLGLEEDVKYYDLLRKLLGYTEKEKKKSTRDNTLQVFKQRLEFFERANQEYEKLLKNYSKEEAKAKIIKSMQDEAYQRGVGGIFMSAEFDEQGTLNSLKRVKAMYKSLSEDMRIEFAKAFGGIELDMDVEIRQDRIKTIQDQFSDLFGNYELSLELDKLGLDKGLASDLFGVEIFDLTELRKRAEIYKDELQNILGKEGVSAWDAINKKITEAEKKQLEARLKQYAEYLKKSISAKAQAEIESQKEIAKIQKTEGLSYETKTALIKQQREETVNIKAKLEWEDFKSSDAYIKMFDDLEYVSDAALKRLKQNLDMVKNSMGELEPDQLKAIQDAYNKIEEQVISRNPFAAMRDAMKEINELQSQGLTEDVLQQNLLMYDAQAQSLKTQIADIETIIGLKQNGISVDTQEQSFLDRNSQYLDQNIETLRQMVTLKKSALSGVEINIGLTSEDLKSYEKARMSLTKMSSEIETIRNLAKNAFNSIVSVLESVGVESDSVAMEFANMGMSMVDLIAQAVMFGIQLQLLTAAATAMGVAVNTALGPIGWAVMAIQGIATALTAIFRIGDKKKEKEIQRQLELVEKLQKSYEKLEEAIDSAYSIDTLEKSTDQAIANLKAQNEALQKSIAAEKDKKKTDDDRIKVWEQTIEDNVERIQELQEEFLANLGGFGSESNVQSAAQEFADAWLDAYLETGDGLDALNDKWDEYIKNVIAKQLMLKGTEKYLKPVMDMLDGMLEDATFTSSEAEDLQDKIDAVMPQLNEFWKSLAGSFDLDGLKEGDTMSGLQRGIQSVTEETAQALEALLNSVRYFTSDSNMQLKNILTALTAPTPENPYLLELKAQTEQLKAMNNLWNSLTKVSSGKGRVLKIEMV